MNADLLKALFKPEQWAQGVADSMSGRVLSLREAGGFVTALTRFDRVYRVTIDTAAPSVVCECRKQPCRHAAAACAHLALTERLRAEAAGMPAKKPAAPAGPNEKVRLLPPPGPAMESTDYRHVAGTFDLRRILSRETVTARDRKTALALLARTRLEQLHIRTNYAGEVLLADFSIRPETTGEWIRVSVECERRALERLCCSEHGELCYYSGTKICVHAAAALLTLDSYLQRSPVGDDTSPGGMRLISLLQKGGIAAAPAPAEEGGQTLALEPLLDWTGEAPSLSFRIGAKKKYVLRNLQTLIETVDAGGRLEMGKEGRFDFSRDRFDPESQRWMELIRAGVTETRQVRDSLQRRTHWEIPKAQVGNIELIGGRLDAFFGRFAPGDPISGSGKLTYAFREGPAPVELHCAAIMDGGGVKGVRLTGFIGAWAKGGARMYCLAGGVITAVAPEKCRVLSALWDTAFENTVNITFGLRQMNGFFRHILPRLEEECAVTRENLDRLEPFIAPDAAFVFYLDADDAGLTCRADAVYGEDRAPLDNDCSGFPFADQLAERRALAAIRASFPEYDGQARVHRANNDEDTVYALLTGGADRLRELGEVLTSDRFSRTRVRRSWHLQVGVRLESGLMRLNLTSDALSPEEIADVLSHYSPKKKFHRLRGGDLVSLEENGESLQALMDAMHLSAAQLRRGDLRIPAFRALYLDRVLEEASGVYAERDRAFRKLIASFKTVADSDLEVPSSLEGVLRPYQKTGFRWLMTLALSGFGGILADDMGLGKTVQVIALILARREGGMSAGPSLVVCPASLVYNWMAEVRKFAPGLRAVPLAGTAAQRRALLARDDADLLITSYGTALRDAAEYAGKRFDCLILDEAQAVKTHTAAQSKAVRLIPADHRFALTGTPIENRLSELWSVFDCLMPGFLYDYASFRRELETPIARDGDAQASARLKQMVRPFILRRLKSDVLKDLPDKLEETRAIELEPEQRRLYDARAQRLAQMLAGTDDAAFHSSRIQVLAELTRLRQICCDPSLVYEEYGALSAKREALRDMLATLRESGHKTLVFSQFPSLLALVEADLKAEGVPSMTLTGATSKQERLALVDRFNRDDTPVFLISLKAGGTGLNLTGADTVIHFDPWWNLAAQNQATDRAHRIGQDRVVTVFRLIARGTIEEKIVELQSRKQDLADAILSGEMGGFAAMTREELLELIAGPSGAPA